MSLTLITGATGNVGSRLVQRLAARKEPVRAFVRKGEQVAKTPGVEYFEGDLGDAKRVREALNGVTKVYLLSAGPQTVQYDANVIDAAIAEKVQQVVKHSVTGAQYESLIFGRWHRAGEKKLEASKLGWTFLRPQSFASNALLWTHSLKSGDAIYGDYGEGSMPVIHPDDIAAVAETVLTSRGHEGKAYELTVPQSLTTAEQVAVLGKLLNRKLQYVDLPDEAVAKSMLGMGLEAAYVDAIVDLAKGIRSYGKVPPTDTVQQLTGNAPKTFEQFLTENLAAFR
jgi:uncharacterized protein YbjT (DUF2867 family)